MAQVGNKINSYLNGEWAKHGRPHGKKHAARMRRIESQTIIKKEINEKEETGQVKRKTTDMA